MTFFHGHKILLWWLNIVALWAVSSWSSLGAQSKQKMEIDSFKWFENEDAIWGKR